MLEVNFCVNFYSVFDMKPKEQVQTQLGNQYSVPSWDRQLFRG